MLNPEHRVEQWHALVVVILDEWRLVVHQLLMFLSMNLWHCVQLAICRQASFGNEYRFNQTMHHNVHQYHSQEHCLITTYSTCNDDHCSQQFCGSRFSRTKMKELVVCWWNEKLHAGVAVTVAFQISVSMWTFPPLATCRETLLCCLVVRLFVTFTHSTASFLRFWKAAWFAFCFTKLCVLLYGWNGLWQKNPVGRMKLLVHSFDSVFFSTFNRTVFKSFTNTEIEAEPQCDVRLQ